MNEKDWLDRIKASAQEVNVPDSLTPENICQKLKKNAKAARGKERRSIRKKAGIAYGISAAAALVVLLGSYTVIQGINEETGQYARQRSGTGQNAELSAAADVLRDSSGESGEDFQIEDQIAAEPRRNAGDLFVVAKDYQEVYDAIRVQQLQHKYNKELAVPEMDLGYMPEGEEAAGDETASSYISSQAEAVKSSADMPSCSVTNVQTKGVDESDIVKTDGSYIYTVTGNQVVITDIRDGKLEKTAAIQLPAGEADETVREMYVDQDRLILVAEGTKIRMDRCAENQDMEGDEGNQSVSKDGQTQGDYYYIDTQEITAVYAYDITSRSKPVMLGKGTQDGSYQTSRKIGEMIYLFTQEVPDISWIHGSDQEENYDWIPLVNEKRIDADCIYIPRQGSNTLIVSSFYMDKPQEQTDNIMIVNNGSNVYVSQNAIYLYEEDYEIGATKIAKFSLGAKLNAVGAVSVMGKVTDTFAVNDYEGCLRVLTTHTKSGQHSSSLYLLDEELNVTGKLEGIAPGETIYSARYLGDMAYFVTYRNIDPLFAVDLSDAEKPKILGELKISGYSDYLHFWGNDKLLGIGYETDPDNGTVKGVKMTMFDISNPADMKAVDTCLIRNTSYSPALDQYKTALVDQRANLIGFAVSGYEQGTRKDNYVLFEWKDGKFINLLTQPLSADLMPSDCRGLYAGTVFYLASGMGISSFDMSGDYKLLKSLDFADME